MKYLQIILLLLLILSSCKLFNNNDDNHKIPNIKGNYSGTFEINDQKVDIRFILNDSTYIGISDSTNFPAIGQGSYSQTKDEIIFINESTWSKYIDQELILNGSYQYDYKDNQLSLWKKSNDETQEYFLTIDNVIEVDERELVKEKLIGDWNILQFPPSTLKFTKMDTIYYDMLNDLYQRYYKLIAIDSLYLIRNYLFEWGIPMKSDTTIHKIHFYIPDSLRIENFGFADLEGKRPDFIIVRESFK